MGLKIFNRKLWYWCGGLVAGGTLLFAAMVAWGPWCDIRQMPPERSFVICDAAGRELYRVLAADGNDCRPVALCGRESWIVKAVVAAEDKRFWDHRGIDPLAVLRAVGQNISGRRRVSGASTISSLVIRLTRSHGKRTFGLKVREFFQAMQLEVHVPKEEILQEYLNRAPFGGNVVGIEAASRRYFDKEWHSLSLAEAALLAGLPQAPSRLRPDRNPEGARVRRNYVLGRMLALGMIDQEEYDAAIEVAVVCKRQAIDIKAPHAVFMVRAEAAKAGIKPQADTLVTTLDPALQSYAGEALQQHLDEAVGGRVKGGGVVVVRVSDGGVVALVGSPDYDSVVNAGQVNGALALRSPGSALKPFLYAAAFDGGAITAATVLDDRHVVYGATIPTNFDGKFRGAVTAGEALFLSLNIPAYRVASSYGVDRFIEVLRSLGLNTIEETPDHYGLALALGGCEVRLWDMAGAYATLAGGGRRVTPHLLATTDKEAGPEVFSEAACWMVSEALAQEIKGGSGGKRVAWKTGTSSGFRDAWCMAWGRSVVVGVWLGNPDGKGDPWLVGASAAVPLALRIYERAAAVMGGEWFERPKELERFEVCVVSGCEAIEQCRDRVGDWRIRGVSLRRLCEVCDSSARAAASGDIAVKRGGEEPKIVSPTDGAMLRHNHWLGEETVIPLEAVSGSGGELFWFANDELVGRSRSGEKFLWRPGELLGSVTVTCADAGAKSDQVKFTLEQ